MEKKRPPQASPGTSALLFAPVVGRRRCAGRLCGGKWEEGNCGVAQPRGWQG